MFKLVIYLLAQTTANPKTAFTYLMIDGKHYEQHGKFLFPVNYVERHYKKYAKGDLKNFLKDHKHRPFWVVEGCLSSNASVVGKNYNVLQKLVKLYDYNKENVVFSNQFLELINEHYEEDDNEFIEYEEDWLTLVNEVNNHFSNE